MRIHCHLVENKYKANRYKVSRYLTGVSCVYSVFTNLFAEGHEEADTRVPVDVVARTWHFILQTCCQGSFSCQVMYNTELEVTANIQFCFNMM